MPERDAIHSDLQARPLRRPLSVTLTAGLVLWITGANWVRFFLSWSGWALLKSLLPFSPAYLLVTGLAWGIVGLGLVWGLWRGKPWTLWGMGLAFATYTLYYWADRLLMPGYSYRNVDGLFWLVINLLVLAWGLWVFSRPRVKRFFGGKDERQPENLGPTPTP